MSIFAGKSLRCRFYRRFSSAVSYRYPLPRDLLSGLALRSDLMSNADRRPLQLSWTVGFLISLRDLDTAAEYARLAYSERYCYSTISTCDSIIGAMCEAKRYRDALDLYHHFFNELKMRATNSSSHIIKALCDQGRVEDALVLFRALSDPCRITYGHLTKALVHTGRFDEALCLLRECPVPMAFTNLIRGFLKQGNLDMANQLLGEFECKGIYPHRHLKDKIEVAMGRVVFIEHWLEQGKDEESMRWYQSLMGNNKFQVSGDTGNALLQLFLRYGKKTEAWELFHWMLNHITVDSETIDIMVSECFKKGHFREGIQTFYEVKAKVESLKAIDYRNVIIRCCEQGMLLEAECLYAELSSDRYLQADVSTYRAMMDAYVKAGRVDDALQTANNMVHTNLKHLALWMYC